MGRYIEWDDVIDRYPELNTLGGADELSSAYIVYAEAMVDGILSSHFTPPFSNNNMVVRDLSIDYCFYRAARFKLENASEVRSAFFEQVGMLKDGGIQMYDSAGNLIAGTRRTPGMYSSTESYHSAFGMDDPIYYRVDSDQQEASFDARE